MRWEVWQISTPLIWIKDFIAFVLRYAPIGGGGSSHMLVSAEQARQWANTDKAQQWLATEQGQKWQAELGTRRFIGLPVVEVQPSWKISSMRAFWLAVMLASVVGFPLVALVVIAGWVIYAVLTTAQFVLRIRGAEGLLLFTGAGLFTLEKGIDLLRLLSG